MYVVKNGRQDKCIPVIFSSIFWAPPRSDGLSCSIQQGPQGAGSGYPLHGLLRVGHFTAIPGALATNSLVNGNKSDFPAQLKFPYFAVANISTTYACRAVARSR